MIASRMVSFTDGRDPAAATAMRLVLARAEVLTAAWDDAWTHLADVRRSRPADPAVGAEVAVIEAQVALGDGRPGSRARAEHLAAQAAGIARDAGRPDLACEALEALGSCARLHDLGAAAAAFARALDVAAAGNLRVHRLRILNELGTVEMLRDARGERLEQARSEASRAGAVGLAVGIGANIAALMAMTARFADAMEVASEVELTSQRLGLIPLQAAALLMQGFAMAHQGRSREMEQYLAAAEAAAPGDPDLRACAWAIGRGISALLAEDRIGARQAFARARAEAPDQHARILNPYEGPECCCGRWPPRPATLRSIPHLLELSKGARWPQLWFGAARAVASGADGDAAGASAALNAALDAADRYPVFSALTMRLAAEAAIRDNWEHPASYCAQPMPLSRGCGWAGHQRPAVPSSKRRASRHRGGGRPTPDCRPPGRRRCHHTRGPGTGPARRPPLQPRDRRAAVPLAAHGGKARRRAARQTRLRRPQQPRPPGT